MKLKEILIILLTSLFITYFYLYWKISTVIWDVVRCHSPEILSPLVCYYAWRYVAKIFVVSLIISGTIYSILKRAFSKK
jgi:RNase P/RNase MRP subunit POP5